MLDSSSPNTEILRKSEMQIAFSVLAGFLIALAAWRLVMLVQQAGLELVAEGQALQYAGVIVMISMAVLALPLIAAIALFVEEFANRTASI